MASGSSLRITSDEVVECPCSPCSEAGKMRSAVKYCVQCDEYFCQPCTDNHSSFRALRRHKLVDHDDFKSSSQQADERSLPTEKCKKHTTKILEMYCKSHDDIGCTTCMTLHHRACPDVLWIPDAVEKLSISSNLGTTKEALVTSKTKLEQLKVIRETALEELKTSKESATKSINQYREDLEKFLAKLEAASLKEVDAEYVAVETRLKNELQEIESQVESLDEDIMKLELKGENKAQRFVELKSAEKTQKTSEQFYTQLSTKPESETIVYNISTDIMTSFQRLKSFGQAKSIKKSYHDQRPSGEESTLVYSVQTSADINSDMQGEKYRSINAACFSEDGLILVTDYKNKTLKRIDVSNRCVKDHCDLPEAPCGMLCTESREVVVLLQGNIVQFVSLKNRMQLARSFTVTHACGSIAYGNNKDLYISDGTETVYVYNMSGKRLSYINIEANGYTGQVAFDTSFNRLYVCAPGSLLIYDHQGNHLATFSNCLVEVITGVCTDGRGSVFVCGQGSKNVAQLTQDGKWLDEIVWSTSGRLQDPSSMCFDTRSNKLCVTEGHHGVKVFDLERS